MNKPFHIGVVPKTGNQVWKRALEYLNNTGLIEVEKFDDDHAPTGPILRFEMREAGLIFEEEGMVGIARIIAK